MIAHKYSRMSRLTECTRRKSSATPRPQEAWARSRSRGGCTMRIDEPALSLVLTRGLTERTSRRSSALPTLPLCREGVQPIRKKRRDEALAAHADYRAPEDEHLPDRLDSLTVLVAVGREYYESYLGKKFTAILDQLREDVRNAVAHLEPFGGPHSRHRSRAGRHAPGPPGGHARRPRRQHWTFTRAGGAAPPGRALCALQRCCPMP
jgi:hypothetical protein